MVYFKKGDYQNAEKDGDESIVIDNKYIPGYIRKV